MQGKIKKKGIFRVAVYCNEQEITSLIQAAEKLGFRRRGIPLRKQKEHGFADEWIANTDGVSITLKYMFNYWQREEPKRLERVAAIMKEQEKLEQEKKQLGGGQ